MLRVGIVGTNFISEWFAAAARRTRGRIEPAAVYSRSAERAAEFARGQRIEGHFSDYAAMLDFVDAVYIASPTVAHYPQAMAAVEAGRHVLVEKTITASFAEAERLFAAAKSRGVVVMEATRHLHMPEYATIRRAAGQLGVLRYAHLEMLQYSSRYDRFLAGERSNAFDPTLGNSALADIGVYCLETAIDLFGPPAAHIGTSFRLENGFEAGGSIQLDFGTMIADVVYSKVIAGVTPSTIIGERGALTIDHLAEPSRIVLRTRSSESVPIDGPRVRPMDTMSHELISFADQARAGSIDPHWREVTLVARRIMDEHLARTES